jgi:hypothetical protein
MVKVTIEIPDAEIVNRFWDAELGNFVILVTGPHNTEYVVKKEWIIKQEAE